MEEPSPPTARKESGGASPPGAGPATAAAAEWYYADAAGKQVGPIAADALASLVEQGVVSSDTLVWKEGMANWSPLSAPEAGFAIRPAKRRPRNRKKVLIFVGLVIAFFIIFLAAGFLVLKWLESRPKKQDDEVLIHRLKESATPQEITDIYKDKVFRIDVSIPGPIKVPVGHGSGIQIANKRARGLVLTNRHVINPPNAGAGEPNAATILGMDVAIKNSSQLNTKPAKIAAFHRRLDVALLITELDGERPSATPVLRKKSLNQGEVAVALGYPRALEFFTSNGIISNTSGKGGFIWTTCPISPGNSGGPLFLARHGYLVGINTLGFKAEFAQNVNGAVPVEEVISPLKLEQTEHWVWSEELKDLTLELVKMVPLDE